MDEEVKIPNNVDIDQALKEFEAKSSVEQVPKVTEVSAVAGLPKIVRLVIKWSGGLIKEERQANYVLLALAVLMFAVSLYFFFNL